MNEDDNKTYSAKVVLVSFALGILLCLFGCVYFYSSRTESTENRNINRTIQQLTTDYEATQRELQQAGERNKDAQNTVDRISDITTESQQLLDRLQAELDEIARANGLSTEREEDNGKTT